jgi:antitoxin component of MazEF toxin-antitoxin module
MSNLFLSSLLGRYMAYPTDTTLIVRTSTKSESLRVTIPQWVVKQLKLKPGHRVQWELKPQGDEFRLLLNPIKKEE